MFKLDIFINSICIETLHRHRHVVSKDNDIVSHMCVNYNVNDGMSQINIRFSVFKCILLPQCTF